MRSDPHSARHFYARWCPLTLLLREQDVRDLLPVSTAVDLLEEAFRLQGEERAQNRPRQRIAYQGGLFQLMGASLPTLGVTGIKTYTSTRSGTRFFVLLIDSHTGALLALFEGDWLGRIRTGAATGLAARWLSLDHARVAGVIGAGGQAETQILAIDAVRDLDTVKVFSRTPERREALVATLQDRVKSRLVAVGSAEEAVRGSQIVVTMTNSREPVFETAWLEPGAFISAAGGNAESRREVEVDTIRRSNLVVVDSLEGAKIESGELIAAVEANALDWGRVYQLGAIVAGQARLPHGIPGNFTLFCSQGIALEDAAAARYVYGRALEEGRGTKIDFGEAPG